MDSQIQDGQERVPPLVPHRFLRLKFSVGIRQLRTGRRGGENAREFHNVEWTIGERESGVPKECLRNPDDAGSQPFLLRRAPLLREGWLFEMVACISSNGNAAS